MKPRVFLDTVCIVRLFGQNLFDKVMKTISIYVMPAIIREITSPKKNTLKRLIETGKVILADMAFENFEEKMFRLIKTHKGKEQAIAFSKGRYSHDLGEFEVMAYVHEYSNEEFRIVTFDNKALQRMKREIKVRPWVVSNKEEQQQLFGLSDTEIDTLRRGYD